MNHLFDLTELRNHYYALRHGQSIANQQGIIVSHPDNGLNAFGLSEFGVSQIERSLRESTELGPDTLLLSSDFRRALESAEIAQRSLQCRRPLETDPRLRERFFGQYEMTADKNYDAIWEVDAIDADSERYGMESANQVTDRVTTLIADCEQRFSGEIILLVSHGDALQLLQTAFLKQDATRHRLVEHLETAEIRRLQLHNQPD